MVAAFRLLPVPLGVVVLVAGGLAHGLWTNRWTPSRELDQVPQRLAGLPSNIGSWKGQPDEPDPEALQQAGAVGNYSRSFTDPRTGEQVLVVLLAGKPNRMVVHRPEHCYRAAGYELSGPAVRCKVPLADGPPAELWTGVFSRDEAAGASHLRTFWTWYAGGRWEAPDNPRWHFSRQRVLYKLYVIRSVAGSTSLESDPCLRLLGELLPILDRALSTD